MSVQINDDCQNVSDSSEKLADAVSVYSGDKWSNIELLKHSSELFLRREKEKWICRNQFRQHVQIFH